MASQSFTQRTLKRPVACEGVGLHSGARVNLQILPASADHGISFVRTDLAGKPSIPARAEFVVDTSLATTLGRGAAKVGTVEHLMAALAGLGIDNARIEVDGPEVPIMDGSAAPFAELLREAGVRRQDKPKSFLVIRRAVSVAAGDKRATLEPSNRFKVDCTIDFKHPLIHDQAYRLEFTDDTFAREVARARTFGFLRDVEKLQSLGLARGGSLQNAIVVDDFNILNPEGLRFPDEFVRHKLLDALGDMSLLGLPVLGHLTVIKSGHQLNHKLVTKVLSDPSNYEVVRAKARDLARMDLVWSDLEGVLAPTMA
jgi:UDP-3-O-[3-hydroxymyristoyl] N-acetylglucosamine deacetylase